MTERIEYRFAPLEFRDDGAVITGVAMPYKSVARIAGAFDESVEPGSFGDDGRAGRDPQSRCTCAV